MKNIYTIIWIIWIIIVWALAYLIGNNQSSWNISSIFQWEKSLIAYVPWELWQVLVLQADEDLKEVAQATNSFDSETFGAVFDTLETVIVYQNAENEVPVNLLFLEWNEQFDISQIEALGLLAEWEDYEARELSDDIVVYADRWGLEWYESQTTSLVDVEEADQFLLSLEDTSYNAWFFSTPAWITQLWWYSALLASNLESTYLLSSLNTTSPTWRLILQMKEDTIPESQSAFEPVLWWYYSDALFYLELQAVKNLLGIDEAQIQTFLPFIAWSAGIPLPSPDGITKLLWDNLALIITPSLNSPVWLQASLIMNSEDHYETLKPLYPLLEQLVWENLPLLGSGWSLTTSADDNQMVSSLWLWDSQLPVLSLTKTSTSTQLSLLWSPLEVSDDILDTTTASDDTVAVFGWDSSLLWQLMWWIVPWGVQSGKLNGVITADDDTDQIVLSFTQTPSDE